MCESDGLVIVYVLHGRVAKAFSGIHSYTYPTIKNPVPNKIAPELTLFGPQNTWSLLPGRLLSF